LIFQREQVEAHGLTTVNHAFGGKRSFSLGLVEDEGLGSNVEGFLHGIERIEKNFGEEEAVFDDFKPLANLSCWNLLTRY
jgi:hypothetical protein